MRLASPRNEDDLLQAEGVVIQDAGDLYAGRMFSRRELHAAQAERLRETKAR